MTLTRVIPVFTVTRVGKKKDAILTQLYRTTISTLPRQSWTRGFRETRDQLEITALIPRVQARNLLLDAFLNGTASIAGTFTHRICEEKAEQ